MSLSKQSAVLTFLVSLLLGLPFSLAQTPQLPTEQAPLTISAHGQVGVAWLPEVTIIAEELHLEGEALSQAIEPQLREQLKYLIGNLHGVEAGAALHEVRLSEVQRIKALEGGLALYRYTAELEVVIAHAELDRFKGGAALKVTLPHSVSAEGLQQFYERALRDCTPNPYRSYEADHFWYYVRPLAFYCELAHDPTDDVAVTVELFFDPQAKQIYELTRNLSPRYEELWADGRLTVTAVFALVGGLLGEQGQEAYQSLFEELVRSYGAPIELNDDSVLGAERIEEDQPVIYAVFESPRGPLELRLFFINSLDTPSHQEGDKLSDFLSEYQRLSARSDLVMYNGHARYGSNNAKLDAITAPSAGDPQIVFVNTCSSYTYGLPRVRQASRDLHDATPDPTGYLDLILNAMPAMGHEMAFMNAHWIHGLVRAEETYQELLSPMYDKQQMLVIASPRSGHSSLEGKGDALPSVEERHTMSPLEQGPGSLESCEQAISPQSGGWLILLFIGLYCRSRRARLS